MSCPFCKVELERIIAENVHALIVRDGYSTSPDHSLVIPKRHIGSFFETTSDEKQALLQLVEKAKSSDESEHAPAAYNIGINDGAAAVDLVTMKSKGR